jgi:triacylglycerol lipase
MLPAVLIVLFGMELLLCAAVGWHFFGPTVMVRLGELAVCIALYLLAVRLVFVGASFAAARRLDRSSPPLRPLAWMRMVVHEYAATLLAFSLLIPFAPLLAPRWKRRSPPDSTVVLLVHGLLSNRGVWWWFARRLRHAGVLAVDSLDLRPLFGDLNALADQVQARIQQLQAHGAQRIVLVGHSMGGLACRACLARHGAGPVVRLITLASPHAGSLCANWLPGANMLQMRPGSAWLSQLPVSLSVPTLALYGTHDNLVLPPSSGALTPADGTRSEAWAALGHLSMLFSKPVAERVLAEFGRTEELLQCRR